MKQQVKYLISRLNKLKGLAVASHKRNLKRALERFEKGRIDFYEMLFEIQIVEEFLDGKL